MADIIYSNSWETARFLDIQREGSSFGLMIDSVAKQLERTGHLFQKGLLENKSSLAGFACVFNDAYAVVGDEVRRSGTTAQAVAGASLGMAKVFGSIPFALVDYVGLVIDQTPNGPQQVAAMAFIESAKGIIAGSVSIIEGVKNLISGDAYGQTVFDISFQVSKIGSEALLMIGGAVFVTKGLIKIESSMSLGIGGSFGGEALALITSIAITDAATLVSGVGTFGGGLVLMSSTDKTQSSSVKKKRKKWTADELDKVLEEVGGNRTQAARKTGLARRTIGRKIKKEPGLARWKDKSGQSKKILTEDELFEVLENTSGNRKVAAEELGVAPLRVRMMIEEAADTSKLAIYKTIKGKGGRRIDEKGDSYYIEPLEENPYRLTWEDLKELGQPEEF